MFKLNRYLLSVLIIVGTNMVVPQQVQAQSNTTQTTERGTSSKKSKRIEKFNTKKFRITADKKQKEAIEQALQDIYSTKSGKELLKRMPKGMEITVEDMEALGLYIHDIHRIELNPNILSDPFQLSLTLLHEMHHCSQECEKRANSRRVGDGIEGYVDFVTKKLCELEPQVFETVYTIEKGCTEKNYKHAEWARYFLKLKEKYQGMGEKEDKATKMARTEFVRTLWESSPDETDGPSSFMGWVSTYHSFTPDECEEVGRRDIRKEYDMIQKYIKVLDVDLDVDYFLDTKKWHLSAEQLAFHTQREEEAQKIKKGSCLRFCKKKTPSRKDEKNP